MHMWVVICYYQLIEKLVEEVSIANYIIVAIYRHLATFFAKICNQLHNLVNTSEYEKASSSFSKTSSSLC